MQRLIVGTHTNDNKPNYLMIAQVQLLLQDFENNACQYNKSMGTLVASDALVARYVFFASRGLDLGCFLFDRGDVWRVFDLSCGFVTPMMQRIN
jgi:hypothetical protein